MTVAILNRQGDDFARRSVPMTMPAGVVDRIPRGRTASALHQNQVNFALAWARWEPGLVAQHYREWFGC